MCSDLLTKDYKVGKTIVEVESKTPAGITFTPTATKSGESVAGTLKAAYPLKGVGDLEATFGTSGSLEASAKMPNAFMPGLTLTAECTKAAAGKGGLLASVAAVVEEYRTARGLQPLRLLVHGNDELAKTELASAIAAEYKLPYYTPASAVAELPAGAYSVCFDVDNNATCDVAFDLPELPGDTFLNLAAINDADGNVWLQAQLKDGTAILIEARP